ncbi:type II secretion system protein GspE, partial [Klebsiella quasipneumoniae]
MKTEQLIPLCRRHHALLLHSDEQTISIAVVDTPPTELMEALRFATQKRIDIECWSQEQMDKRLQVQEKQALLAQNAGPENIAERVNQILEQALRQRASDIHIEPTEAHLRIRLRVDGVLHALPLLAPELAAPVIARLKV